ncbi:MAG: enoyl-CoA hydratase/isomerase family protein [Steroidobacteraceae bacterium]|jgi:2-(1,2-epoxy-1,2-dihydrophenyl)acetyl-CoA isomerase|nr:enoyl-CoA hydratase/isomerase family protein [Steroidobacteraceae bacterium]
MTQGSTVLVEARGPVRLLTLNRPDNANVLDLQMGRELRAAAESVASDAAVRAVVLTGAGKHFCFGGDLRGMLAGSLPGDVYLRELTGDLHRAIVTLVRMDAPLVAAINGTAAGAGVGLAAMADLAVCGEGTKFSLAYTGVALTPDGSTSFFLPKILGQRRALELMLTNRPLGAAEALQWGLVNQVVPDAEVLAAGLALAERLAAGPRGAQSAVRKLVALAVGDLEAHLAVESDTIARQSVTPEGQEGMKAFLEKRKPRFA